MKISDCIHNEYKVDDIYLKKKNALYYFSSMVKVPALYSSVIKLFQ